MRHSIAKVLYKFSLLNPKTALSTETKEHKFRIKTDKLNKKGKPIFKTFIRKQVIKPSRIILKEVKRMWYQTPWTERYELKQEMLKAIGKAGK